jgi:hypothetical protein
MPSVTDILKWRDRWTKLNATVRNGLMEDAIQWLETVGKAKCKPEEVATLVKIQDEIKSRMNDIRMSDQWFVDFGQVYGQQSYFDSFVRKVM